MRFSLRIAAAGLIFAGFCQAEESSSSVQLEEVLVVVPGTVPGTVRQDRATAEGSALAYDLTESIRSIPGVDGVTRGADAAEPVIRGLGWERVSTQIDGMCLAGSCPSRMDPPLSMVALSAVDSMEVMKALPSVTAGPGGTAGRVLVSSRVDPASINEAGPTGEAELIYQEGRDGFTGRILGESAAEKTAVRAGASVVNLNDYESGGGKTVPAENRSFGGSLSVGVRPSEYQLIYGTWNLHRVDHTDYPSLPMDATYLRSDIGSVNYELTPDSALMQRFLIHVGFSDVDHTMDNARKANRKLLHASSETEARTLGLSVLGDLRASDTGLFTIGTDFNGLSRDGTRTRVMQATGATMYDRIWPDVTQDNIGLFAEMNSVLTERWTLRVGARLDYMESDAGAADAPLMLGPSSKGMTVRDAYVQYYGPDAGQVDRSDTYGGGNVMLEWADAEGLRAYVGAGLSSRAAAATERYFAYSPAPGGYVVGNPSLDPEAKWETCAGVSLSGKRSWVDVEVFASRVNDYIYSTIIDRVDVNGDGVTDTVRGYRNVDAELYGAEAGGLYGLNAAISIPWSLAMVVGRNRSLDRDLPEIPPLSGDVGLLFEPGGTLPWWCSATMRFATEQDRIDPTFGETATDAYEVFDLAAGIAIPGGWSLEIGVDNLFDRDYAEHLSREVPLPTGDLAAGEKVPEPGRFFYAAIRLNL